MNYPGTSGRWSTIGQKLAPIFSPRDGKVDPPSGCLGPGLLNGQGAILPFPTKLLEFC